MALPSKQSLSRMVAGYARFSPDDATKISIEMQDSEMRKVCLSKGWNYYKTYTDPDVSGGIPPFQLAKTEEEQEHSRPGLTELIDDLDSKQFNVVMILEVSRLARDQATFWNIIDMFTKKGIVCTQAMIPDIDSSMPTFQMVAGVTQAVASFQRIETKDKTKKALATLKQAGFAVSRAPLGFELVAVNPSDPEHSHKRLELSQLGRRGRDILNENPKVKAVAFATALGLEYKTAWHLLNNLRKAPA